MPVLDTDVLSIVQRRTEPGYSRLLGRLRSLDPSETVWSTIVSYEEQLRGWLEYIKRARVPQLAVAYQKLYDAHLDFQTRPMLPFDLAATRAYEDLLKAKTGVATMDLRIASICIANNLLLVSVNLRDFRKIPGLRVEDRTC